MAAPQAKSGGEKKDYLPLIAVVLLVVYNLVFFLGKFSASMPGRALHPVYLEFKESLGFFTLLELIGVAAVFVDSIVRYERLSKNAGIRRLRLALAGLILMAFIFKLFINYLDSAYLTE